MMCQSGIMEYDSSQFLLISLQTEIAISVRGLKLQGPRAADAMAEPYLVLKILVT